jgi:hypothetical protein
VFINLKVPKRCFCRSNISVHCQRLLPRARTRTVTNFRPCPTLHPRRKKLRTAFRTFQFRRADGSSRTTAIERSTGRRQFLHMRRTHHIPTNSRLAQWTLASAKATEMGVPRITRPDLETHCRRIFPRAPLRHREDDLRAAAFRNDLLRAHGRSGACKRHAVCPKRLFSQGGKCVSVCVCVWRRGSKKGMALANGCH